MTVVVGTAGHIDHGKTTLLRALTGIDADRLPEERRRGMTIDVGYAHLAFDDGAEIDFVDVPGHDRLVGNMLVGAGEIDAALLVVAADDGPRAQTLEHLGAARRARDPRTGSRSSPRPTWSSPARSAEVATEVRELLEPTSLAGSPSGRRRRRCDRGRDWRPLRRSSWRSLAASAVTVDLDRGRPPGSPSTARSPCGPRRRRDRDPARRTTRARRSPPAGAGRPRRPDPRAAGPWGRGRAGRGWWADRDEPGRPRRRTTSAAGRC